MTKREAEQRVTRAAMKWFDNRGFFYDDMGKVEFPDDARKLERACHVLAAQQKKRKR